MKYDKLKMLIPFAPLIILFIVLMIRPYFLFPVGGDTDFHLARAREIMQNPTIYGIFWDNITYYSIGRPIWHQPLFHILYSSLWVLGGVRFAHSFMCLFQILLTVGVASWIAYKEYGLYAGYFAGIFALLVPSPPNLIVAIPAAYIPILAVLTIYYIPKDKKKAFIASLLGLWTHMVALACFIPLYLVDNYRDRTNLKIIALLLPSWLFWVGYWAYFKDKLVTGGLLYSITNLKVLTMNYHSIGSYFFLIPFMLGAIGIYLLYRSNYRQYKLYFTYILIVFAFSLFGFNGDYIRGFQFASLPMAILAGLTVQRGYEFLSNNYSHIISFIFLLGVMIVALLGAMFFFAELPNQHQKGWDALEIPFEDSYYPLKTYIVDNTEDKEVIWVQNNLTDKVAWMTGRSISNGLFTQGEYGATKGFVGQNQRINIYISPQGTFLVKDIENKTIIEILPLSL